LVFDKASAPDLQQAQPTRKQAMCKHMVDGRGYKGGDASAVKNQILKFLGYKRLKSKVREIHLTSREIAREEKQDPLRGKIGQDLQDGLIFILPILPTSSILSILFFSMNTSRREVYHAISLLAGCIYPMEDQSYEQFFIPTVRSAAGKALFKKGFL